MSGPINDQGISGPAKYARAYACHDGEPGLATFWPKYAYGIIKRRVNHITGPKVPLVRSATDM